MAYSDPPKSRQEVPEYIIHKVASTCIAQSTPTTLPPGSPSLSNAQFSAAFLEFTSLHFALPRISTTYPYLSNKAQTAHHPRSPNPYPRIPSPHPTPNSRQYLPSTISHFHLPTFNDEICTIFSTAHPCCHHSLRPSSKTVYKNLTRMTLEADQQHLQPFTTLIIPSHALDSHHLFKSSPSNCANCIGGANSKTERSTRPSTVSTSPTHLHSFPSSIQFCVEHDRLTRAHIMPKLFN